MLRTKGSQLLGQLRASGVQRAAFATEASTSSAAASSSGAGSSGGGAGAARPKSPEQLTPEELAASMPSNFFTASNLIISTAVASAVAAAGLFSMFFVGTLITDAARQLKQAEAAAVAPAPAAPPKSLAELIEERRAELEAEVAELRGLPRTREVRQRLAAVQSELRQYRPPGSWWRWW